MRSVVAGRLPGTGDDDPLLQGHLRMTLSVTPTPGGSSILWRASMVLALGSAMSMRRLWIRISKCSRESLYLGGADHRVAVLLGRQGDGAPDGGARAGDDLDDLADGLVEQGVVMGP